VIDFTDTINQGVSWGALSPLQGMASRTLLAWVNFDAYSGAHNQIIAYPLYGTGSNEYWDFFYQRINTEITTGVAWSTSAGFWGTPRPATGGWHHVGVTYNNSSTSNDPLMYMDGASATVTERQTPSGTYVNGTTTITTTGARTSGTEYPIDGKLGSLCIYNRILSASEIAEAYASRLAIPTWRGLVFAPQLHQRGEVGEGGTLTASHTIADAVSGALGTPSGSPLFRGDTHLTYSGVS
jgi:hypothetical protein